MLAAAILANWLVVNPLAGDVAPVPGALTKADNVTTIKDLYTLTEKAKDGKTRMCGSGSGFFITPDGRLVTNQHVVDGAAEVVAIWQGRAFMMDVVAVNRELDLALLQPVRTPFVVKSDGVYECYEKPPEFPYLGTGASRKCRVGDEVYVVGYPNIHVQGMAVKVTKGIVSSLSGFKDDANNFQMDAAIQRGNSGGPVVGECGGLLGVSVAWLRGGQNVNYAIKLDVAEGFLAGQNVRLSVMADMPFKKSAMLEKVSEATALIVVYESGVRPLEYDAETRDERTANEKYARARRNILSARLLKVRKEWKDLKKLTDRLLADMGPVEDVKDMNDLAREELGLHLVIVAEVENADVDATVKPICGIEKDNVKCGEPFALFCEGKKKGFPVKAELKYEKDGKLWCGDIDLVYDWRGTKEVRVRLDASGVSKERKEE